MDNTVFVILGGILGVAQTVLGWFAKTLWDAVQDLKTDLSKLREELAKDYVPKEDFKDSLREIKEMFVFIRDKLDTKADK
jgi:hypothetical protein